MKKLFAVCMIALSLTVPLSVTASATSDGLSSPTFSDVPTSHWAYRYVENCYTKGLIDGVGDGRFAPEGELTSAEIAQILYNAYGERIAPTLNESWRIQDLYPSDWWYDAARWVVDTGIGEFYERHEITMDGYVYDSVIFAPRAPCYRVAAANQMYNVATALDVELPNVVGGKINFPDLYPYTPHDKTVEEAFPYIVALYNAGIIQGYPDGTFGYADSITRAELCKIMDMFTDIPGLESADMLAS